MRKTVRLFGLVSCLVMIASAMLAGCSSATPNQAATSPAASAAASAAASVAATVAAAATPAPAPSSAIDISKAVSLSMYLIGGPSKDYDSVLAAFNKKLQPDLNATLGVNWVAWGDFSTKYPLILASGEPIDLIYASTWTNFYQNAQKGAFMALDDLAPKYCPTKYAAYSKDWLGQATVNGHLYGLPAVFSQVGMMGFIVRGDLMKKYNIPDIHSIDDFGVYMDTIKKNEPTLDPSGLFSTADELDGYYVRQQYHAVNITNWLFYNIDTGKVFCEADLPDMPAFYAKMKDWSDKGYWPKSVLSNKDDQVMTEGKAAARLHNQDTWNSIAMQHPEWDVRFYWAQPWGVSTVAMQDGMAVPASAQNPERALMMMEKLYTDQDYYNLLTYGVEGQDFTVTSDNLIKATDVNTFAPEGYCSWGFKDPRYYKPLVGSPANLMDVKNQLKSIAIKDPYALFTPNNDPIKNEVAAINDVWSQYEVPLGLGYIADPVQGLATLKDKLKTAGIEKVVSEMQSQLDAFKAAHPQ